MRESPPAPRIQAKIEAQLGVVVAAQGQGRAMRQRRAVNYAFDDYDKNLRDAIRRTQRGEGSDSEEESGEGRLSPAADEPLPEGVRRGRSAARWVLLCAAGMRGGQL